jgi:hypothetical protein
LIGYINYLYLAHFSKPAADRTLYRCVRRQQAARILQIGIATPHRALRLIATAGRGSAAGVAYVALDQFEARPQENPGMALKDAYRVLKPTGARVQLVPGEIGPALARSANALGQMDLVVITSDYDETSIGAGWYYLPRMLHASSRVFLEKVHADASTPSWRLLTSAEIAALAAENRPRRAA